MEYELGVAMGWGLMVGCAMHVFGVLSLFNFLLNIKK
jgi:hypothetical protein